MALGKIQAHLVLKLARDVTGNEKSFYYHMSNKRINNESVHQLLKKSGDLLAVDADKALNSPARSAVLCIYRVQGAKELPVLEED